MMMMMMLGATDLCYVHSLFYDGVIFLPIYVHSYESTHMFAM